MDAVVYLTVFYFSKCTCAQVPVGESLETEHALIMAINASSTMDVFFYSAYSSEAAGRWGFFSQLSTDLLCCLWWITSSKGDGGERVLFSFQLKYLYECTKCLLLSLYNTTVRVVTEMKVCQVENFRV